MPEKNRGEIDASTRELFDKGNAALQKGNLDYAVALLNQVLSAEPAFFEARQALRIAQLKKAGDGPGFFKKMMGSASASPTIAKGQMALRKNPLEAIEAAEQVLNSDPNSLSAHKLMAQAAVAAGFPRTAVLSFDFIAKANPKDRDLAIDYANALADIGHVARAEGLLADLQKQHPSDPELNQALKNLSARRTLKEGGYDALSSGKGSYRDILRNKEEAVSLEQEKREVKDEDVALRLIREYTARLETEPGNLKLIRNVAELYAQKQDYDNSLAWYQRLLVSGNTDPTIEKLIADTTVRKFEYQIAQLDATAANYAEEVKRIEAEKQAYTLQECKLRVERYPADLLIRFEHGLLCYKAGKIGEAIQELQKAQNNPNKRLPAMLYLGLSFSKRGMNDLAARTLQNALKEKPAFDEEKKELIYTLGCILEKMGNTVEAIEQFKQIYELDIGYRDVAAKVDAYYASQEGN